VSFAASAREDTDQANNGRQASNLPILVPFLQQNVTLFRANKKPRRVALPRAFIASGCARALLLFPHPHGSLRLKGIHFVIESSLENYQSFELPCSTALSSSDFPTHPRPHAPVKLVSPPCLCFRAPPGGRFRQMAPKSTRGSKGNVHVAARPKQRTYFV
jgi:hypothetical protein